MNSFQYLNQCDGKKTIGGVRLNAFSLEDCARHAEELQVLGFTWIPSMKECTTVKGSSTWQEDVKDAKSYFGMKKKETFIQQAKFDTPRILVEVLCILFVCSCFVYSRS
jgi:hypothetical protein